MQKTNAQTSMSSHTPKDSPVTVETFADVLKLMEVDNLDISEETQAFAVQSTKELIEERGADYIRQNRHMLANQLEQIDSM